MQAILVPLLGVADAIKLRRDEEIADPKLTPPAGRGGASKSPNRRVEGGHLSREGSYHGVTLGIPSAEM